VADGDSGSAGSFTKDWKMTKFPRRVVLLMLALCAATISNVRAQDAVPGAKAYRLTGVWAGLAYLDEDKLKEKFDKLETEEQKETFLRRAESFLSGVAAFEFKPDGTFESDVEIITTEGKSEGAQSSGTYQIVEVDGPKFIIEITEQGPDGKPIRERKLLQFYEDGDHMGILVPAPDLFADCNPLMVFERMNPRAMAEESIAQQPGAQQIK
jgi:hypothetical protein